MKFYIYTDGASRGNPGESASGYRIMDLSKKLVRQHVIYNGVCTNNVAEYLAIIAALDDALKMDGDEIVLHSDSKLVISQLSGAYRTKDRKMKELNAKAKALLGGFKKHTLLSVPRTNKEVSAVDSELNIFLDARSREKPKKEKKTQTRL